MGRKRKKISPPGKTLVKEKVIFVKPHKKKSPSIYRNITESFKKFISSPKLVYFTVMSFILIVVIAFLSFSLYKTYQEKEALIIKRQNIIVKILYWKNIIAEHKDYRDGYFQIAVLDYRLGNIEESNMYLQKALALDPNFKEGRKLEKILGNNNY